MFHPMLPTTSIELRELCEILSIALVVPLNPDQYLKDKKLYMEAQRKLKLFETKNKVMKKERTAYMQHLMRITYHQIPIIALLKGSLDGAWEEAIADQLMKDQTSINAFRVNDATTILKEVAKPGETWDKEVCIRAADYIINNTIVPQ